MCRRLEREGYTVTGFVTGRELIARLGTGLYADLMLLDYNLSDYDAAKIVVKLKEIESSVPFIVCTGVGSESIAVNMMKEGARDYLVKDKVFLDVLIPTVKKVLSEISIEKDLQEAREKLLYQNAVLKAVH